MVKKVPFEVDVHGEVKIRFGHVLREVFRPKPDIVDQHVDATEGGVGVGDSFSHRRQIGEVHLYRQRAPADALDLGSDIRAVGTAAHANDHVGARAGAGERASAPDAARRADDQHHLVSQIEFRRKLVCHLNLP